MRILLFLFSLVNLFSIESTHLKDIKRLPITDDKYQYVYLVRHGESKYNLPDENGVYYTQGQSAASPLTNNGKKQAITIASIIRRKISPKASVVIASSNAERASFTASSISKALSKKCKVKLDKTYKGLLEIAKGRWEGLPKDEKFNKEFDEWKKLSAYDQWETPQVSTAESLKETAERASVTLEKIVKKYPNQTLFIVSHGGTLMGIEHKLKKTKFSKAVDTNFPKFRYKNCDMLLLKIPKGKSFSDAKIQVYIQSGFPNTYK